MQPKPKYRKEYRIKLCYNKKYVQSLPILLHSQINPGHVKILATLNSSSIATFSLSLNPV